MQNSEIKSLKLKRDKNGSYYLRAVYEYENDYIKKEIVIPKILLPITRYPELKVEHSMFDLYPTGTVDIGFGDLNVAKGMAYPGMPDCYCAEKVLEEKAQTMTLAEIEKKLGYKINLVSEEKED